MKDCHSRISQYARSHGLTILRLTTLTSLFALLTAGPALAQRQPEPVPSETRTELPTRIQRPQSLNAEITRVELPNGPYRSLGGSLCETEIVAHTSSDFEVGPYTLQGGFVEGEVAAASYELDPSEFPIQIDNVEMLFSTFNATVQTTTEWSIIYWDGTPTNGTIVGQFSSDDVLLPHLVLGPGTEGGIINVTVDPTDNDQIIIYNDSGTNTFTVGFRIDAHNDPGIPCIIPSDENANAFPATDNDGLASSTGNWIKAVPGTFCCPAGWFTFQSASPCAPNGDWVLRASYTPFSCNEATGACCLTSGNCVVTTPSECSAIGGTYQGEATTCETANCPLPTGGCCVADTGGCADVTQSACGGFGGVYQGDGTTCGDTPCFPEGACCVPTGECVDDMTPESCEAFGGTFQGDNSTCSSVTCPEPTGACCSESGACFEFTEATCLTLGGTWEGVATTCPASGECESNDCPTDFDGDGMTGLPDFSLLLVNFGTQNDVADADGDGLTGLSDFSLMLVAFGEQCP